MTDTVDALLPFFRLLEWHEPPALAVKHGDECYAAVECDRQRPRNDPGLRGEVVVIDAALWTVVAVERNMPHGPIRQGETIGLIVRPWKGAP